MSQQVSAMLLAAGQSRRMGHSKPLLPLGDRPVIRHCLDSLLAARVDEIVLVTGPDPAALKAAVTGLPVTMVCNDDPESDMAGSVRVGLRSVSATTSALLVCLVDHPLVSATTIRTLIERHAGDPASILIPCFQGKRGHPTLFPMAVINELSELPTLRDLVRRAPDRIQLVAVDDEGTVNNMNTPDDYQKVQDYWQRRTGLKPREDYSAR